MTIRNWIIDKLKKRYVLDLEGDHGLRIGRQHQPDALVYCVEPDEVHPFDVDDLEAALEELPGAQFLVLVRRDATHRAYERAADEGVCVDTFGELSTALDADDDISAHQSREQTYVRSRMLGHRSTSEIRRRGKTAYEISRTGSMRHVTIVTIEHYELTADGVYTLLEEHDHLDVDAIVTTNPYARGFARQALHAAENADAELMTFNDFLAALSHKWI